MQFFKNILSFFFFRTRQRTLLAFASIIFPEGVPRAGFGLVYWKASSSPQLSSEICFDTDKLLPSHESIALLSCGAGFFFFFTFTSKC